MRISHNRAVELYQDFMSIVSFDCVSCGACCFSRNPRYLVLFPEDASRNLPQESLFEAEDKYGERQTYMRFEGGRCTQLCDGGQGRRVCGVYEARPEACRAFRAGSFECVKARRANGILGERAVHDPLPLRVVRELDDEFA